MTKIPDKPSATVRDYLRLAASATKVVRDRRGNGIQQAVAHQTAALLREARVFHLNPAVYMGAYHAADVYTTCTLAGLSWVEPDPAHQVLDFSANQQRRLSMIFNDGLARGPNSAVARNRTGRLAADEEQQLNESRVLLEAMQEGQLQEAFPEPLPFPALYIGFGGSIMLTPFQVAIALQESTVNHRSPVHGARHLGYTLGQTDESGPVVLEHMETPGDGPITICRYYDGSWVGLMSLAPWVVNSLVALINENRSVVEETAPTPAMRYEHAKVKIERLIPRPFYVLRLQPQMIDASMRRNKTLGRYTFHYAYRFDVRGHERIRVQRGPTPIDDATREKLIKRGYTLYDRPDAIPPELVAKLDLRGFVMPLPGEWLAVLTTWVAPHQKGPTEAPYVPAIRTLKKIDDSCQPPLSRAS